MDIVIPLGKGSRWENNELRYTLRSIEKYITGTSRLFIVGLCPDWLTGDFVHIPFEDAPGGEFRDLNIFSKILAACSDQRLSSSFIYFSDDHYLLTRHNVSEYPYFFKGSLSDTVARMSDRQPYRRVLENTVSLLSKKFCTVNDFQCHCPVVYDKNLFWGLKTAFGPELLIQHGFAIKSLYCNYYKIPGVPYTDLKIIEPLSFQQIAEALDNRAFFSIGNRSLSGGIKEFLQYLYPLKSKYEK